MTAQFNEALGQISNQISHALEPLHELLLALNQEAGSPFTDDEVLSVTDDVDDYIRTIRKIEQERVDSLNKPYHEVRELELTLASISPFTIKEIRSNIANGDPATAPLEDLAIYKQFLLEEIEHFS